MMSALTLAAVACGVALSGGWRFQRDASAKADWSAAETDVSGWTEVRVPHDWAIAGPFDPKANGGSGKLPWQGVGWYRTTFAPSAPMQALLKDGGRAYLEFDGVLAEPKVWLNGQAAGGWDYGYMSFALDVTKLLKDGENVLTVRADSRRHQTRWYPGAGLYREVRLVVRPAHHVLPNTLAVVATDVSSAAATVKVSAETTRGPTNFSFVVKSPKLWDVESPNLYTLELLGETFRYGIRTARFTADDGFHLNGRRLQLKGVCLHSDLGPLGMAFDRSAAKRQLLTMKDMGVNALRTSHNAPDPKLLDLCDELGVVVCDEAFDKWGGGKHDYVVTNLQAFVRRDRNHPSVICWSIGNEIPQGEGWGMSKGWFHDFRAAIREVDATRPVTIAVSPNVAADDTWNDMFRELDLVGFNYSASYRTLKSALPKMPLFYSESASAVSSYGYYDIPPAPEKTAYATNAMETSGYDHNAPCDIPDVEFARVETDRYLAGEFVWTGIDYLGEPTPYSPRYQFKKYPRGELARSSYFGACDLCAFPKDRFWLYRSYWNKAAETVHLLPHWNWRGREGQNVPVYVYTSGDEAELFLNGRSLGRRKKGPCAKPRNLAAGAKTSASSELSQFGTTYSAANAVDGDAESKWQGATMETNEWFQVDMGEVKSFTGIGLVSPGPICWGYTILVSDDGKDWSVYRKKHEDEWKAFWFKPGKARYVRVRYDLSRKWVLPTIYELCVFDETDEAKLVLSNPYYDVCARYRLRWFDVPYEPGELKAVAYRDGKKIGETVVATTEKPVAVRLARDPYDPAEPDGLEFVKVEAVDAKGRADPQATADVSFALEGPGEIVSVGNGDPRSHKSFKDVAHHPLYFGQALVVIRRTPGTTAPLKLTASSAGLKSAVYTCR